MAAATPFALAGLPAAIPPFPDPYVDAPTDFTEALPNGRGTTAGCYTGVGFSDGRMGSFLATRPSILNTDHEMRYSYRRFDETCQEITQRNANAPGPNADGTPNVYEAMRWHALAVEL